MKLNLKHFFPLPQLAYWGNLPAFGGVVFLIFGITFASLFAIPQAVRHTSLYPFLLLSTMIGLCAACVCSGKLVKYMLFGLTGCMLFWVQMVSYTSVEVAVDALGSTPHTITGTVATPPVPYHGRVSFLMRVSRIDRAVPGVVSGKFFLCTSSRVPAMAHLVTVTGTIKGSRKREHRYGYDEYTSFAARNIAGRIDISGIHSEVPPRNLLRRAQVLVRSRIIAVLKAYPSPNNRAILRASFIGERAYIPGEIADAFAGAGLTHILALSGFHVTMVVAALYALLLPLPVRMNVKHLLTIVTLWGYLFFVGPLPSLARAVIMTTVVIAAHSLQRKQYTLQTLGIAGIVWLVLSPASLFEPGFQLSYAATFGIITLYPSFKRTVPECKNPYGAFFVKSLWLSCAVSLSAGIVTFPLVVYHFGVFSPYGTLATLVAVPILTAGMWAFFAALLLPAFPGVVFITISDTMMHWLISVAKAISALPGASLPLSALHPESIVVYYGVLFFIVMVHQELQKRIAVPLMAIVCCFIPITLLAHRCFDAPQLVVLQGKMSYPECIIRWPSGNACVAGSRGGALSVAHWVHKLPGTGVSHWCLLGKKGEDFTDSSAAGIVARALLQGDDTLQIADLGNALRTPQFCCRFIPQKKSYVISYREENVVLHLSDDCAHITMVYAGSSSVSDTQHVPCMLTFTRRGPRIISFN